MIHPENIEVLTATKPTYMIAELTTTHHMIDDVEPQDEAMDTFRSHFHLVANCNVVPDGKLMIYSFNSKEHASVWFRNAQNIIKACNLPLVAELNTNLCGTFLHIIYKPLK